MGLLKDLYSVSFYNKLADNLEIVISDFDRAEFLNRIYVSDFEQMELKQRMRQTTSVLHGFLSPDFPNAVDTLYLLINQLRRAHFGEDHLAMMFLPDYIEQYGLDDIETSVKALEFITGFITCEFAVRPFLLKHFDLMMKQMQMWSLHENSKVRRLASEGTRPALPWGMAVPCLKKDPSLILPILENLKRDSSDSVRRSVANNLNDISKNQPALVLEIAARWKGLSKETDAIIKHGCRTLLKQGHAGVLAHYSLVSTHVELTNFDIITAEVQIGDNLEFSFAFRNIGPVKQTIRLEYAVYYKRLNGTDSKKVFKISERDYAPGVTQVVNKKQSFRLITTRKFYPGKHYLSIIMNGQESELKRFELV